MSNSNAWAAGSYLPDSGHNLAPLIEHWNGSAWSVSLSPTTINSDAILRGLDASSATDAWTVGSAGAAGDSVLTYHWDGKSWTQVPAISPGGVANGVADISPANAWMVGGHLTGNTPGPAFIEHWDGTAWALATPAGLPANSELTSVSALSATDIWAVGVIFNAANTLSPLVVHYDGTSWAATPGIPSPGTNSQLNGVAVTSTGALAVGEFTDASGSHPLAVRWDGTTWTQVPAPRPGGAAGLLAVGGTSNNYWAVGFYQTGGSTSLSPLYLHCC